MKDFDHFVDRSLGGICEMGTSPTDEMWNKTLVKLRGDEWRDVRSTFSPVFTSGRDDRLPSKLDFPGLIGIIFCRMRMMMPFIAATSDTLAAIMSKSATAGAEVELKDLCGRFSMDSIASCAFGIEANSFSDKDSPFVEAAKSFFQFDAADSFKMFAYHLPLVGRVFDLLRIPILKPVTSQFVIDTCKETLRRRRETGKRRNDFVDLMVDATKDKLKDGEAESIKRTRGKTTEIGEQHVISTAVILLGAGYDTTGSALSFLFYNLAKNPEIQERLQEEVDEAYEKSGASDREDSLPDYQTLTGMEYLEQVNSSKLTECNDTLEAGRVRNNCSGRLQIESEPGRGGVILHMHVTARCQMLGPNEKTMQITLKPKLITYRYSYT